MNIRDLINLYIKRIWIVILLTSLIGGYMYVELGKKSTYTTNLTLGLSLNSLPQSDPVSLENINQSNSDNIFINTLGPLSRLMLLRFKSLSVQKTIADEANIALPATAEKVPIYDVIENGLGYITITYKDNNEETVNKVKNAIIRAYKNVIIPEWNEKKQDKYKIKAQDNINQAIVKSDNSLQTRLTPAFAVFVLASIISLLVPSLKQEEKKIKDIKIDKL